MELPNILISWLRIEIFIYSTNLGYKRLNLQNIFNTKHKLSEISYHTTTSNFKRAASSNIVEITLRFRLRPSRTKNLGLDPIEIIFQRR